MNYTQLDQYLRSNNPLEAKYSALKNYGTLFNRAQFLALAALFLATVAETVGTSTLAISREKTEDIKKMIRAREDPK